MKIILIAVIPYVVAAIPDGIVVRSLNVAKLNQCILDICDDGVVPHGRVDTLHHSFELLHRPNLVELSHPIFDHGTNTGLPEN